MKNDAEATTYPACLTKRSPPLTMEASVTGEADACTAEKIVDCLKSAMGDDTAMKLSCEVDIPAGIITRVVQVLNCDPALTAQALEGRSRIRLTSATMSPVRMQAMIQAVAYTVMQAPDWKDCVLQLPLHKARVLHAGLCLLTHRGIRNLQPFHEHAEQAAENETIRFQTTLNESALRQVVVGILDEKDASGENGGK